MLSQRERPSPLTVGTGSNVPPEGQIIGWGRYQGYVSGVRIEGTTYAAGQPASREAGQQHIIAGYEVEGVKEGRDKRR